MSREKELIREYVKIILENESDGPTTFGDYSGGGVFGGSYGGAGSTKMAIVNPITDVMKIVKGKIKELFRSAWYVAEFALKSALSLLTLGLYDAKYESIHQSYLGSMSKIRSQYSQAVSDSIQAFLRNDVMSAAFFYNPGLYMTGKGAISFLEGKVLEEDKKDSAKTIKAGENLSRAVIDKYFEELASSLQALAEAKKLEDLEIDEQTYTKVNRDLDAITDEMKREEAEAELLKAAKLQIFTDEMKKLKTERESMIKSLQSAGVPLDVIMNPEGLVVRYEREMRKLASLSDSI